MEIDFNTRGRIPQAESSPAAAKRDSTAPAPDSVSFLTSDSLNSKLSQISTVRPEQVARAKALVADTNYPPDYVLNRIANLLAIHTKASPSGESGTAS
jgi:hypothetical protein